MSKFPSDDEYKALREEIWALHVEVTFLRRNNASKKLTAQVTILYHNLPLQEWKLEIKSTKSVPRQQGSKHRLKCFPLSTGKTIQTFIVQFKVTLCRSKRLVLHVKTSTDLLPY